MFGTYFAKLLRRQGALDLLLHGPIEFALGQTRFDLDLLQYHLELILHHETLSIQVEAQLLHHETLLVLAVLLIRHQASPCYFRNS